MNTEHLYTLIKYKEQYGSTLFRICRHCPVTPPALICWSFPRLMRSGPPQHLNPNAHKLLRGLTSCLCGILKPARCFLCLRASIFITDVAVMPFPSRVYGCVRGELMLHYTKCLQSVAAFIRSPGHLRPYDHLQMTGKNLVNPMSSNVVKTFWWRDQDLQEFMWIKFINIA